MDKLLDKMHDHCVKALEEIEMCVDKHGGFSSSRQIDDMKDLLQSIREMHQIQAMPKKSVV